MQHTIWTSPADAAGDIDEVERDYGRHGWTHIHSGYPDVVCDNCGRAVQYDPLGVWIATQGGHVLGTSDSGCDDAGGGLHYPVGRTDRGRAIVEAAWRNFRAFVIGDDTADDPDDER